MIAVDKESILVISGNGEVIEPDEDYVAIGSGGNFAYAAAAALYNHTKMGAEEIVKEALKIAADICVFTNDNIVIEKLDTKEENDGK
jgi:ATP-dependent HslUV protease subunit HslV